MMLNVMKYAIKFTQRCEFINGNYTSKVITNFGAKSDVFYIAC